MIKIDDSIAYLSTWQRAGCALSAVLMFYNYLLPWPPASRVQFGIGFFGAIGLSLAAIVGNRVRVIRWVTALCLLMCGVLLLSKLSGHAV
ncbi:MAG: hypothetical protein KGJ32_13295 [Xanthomonadaceae bacterium]|nr:hypothetical protein [Xanthomonadaceae bacterium]